MIVFPLSVLANDFCEKLDKSGITNGVQLDNTDNLYKVGGKGHLLFYSAPDEKCLLKGIFVIPNDHLYAYVELNGFYRVMYLSNNDDQIMGWVKKNRLIETHKGLAPDYNNPG
ncbi:hypothetical protein EE896_11155 [Pantoea eucalypti]|uniref:Uncharacterized protein n=1 Tax=Pantoea eucalypti TaxID=470933 RepID=A0ABY2ZP83_9GAMM|nr:hypothetical protein [Pantoea eucalypti]QGF27360.1 hypothetical protein EE896_11155 [Pantoea eucalypti]TPV43386.1 hypothetical protein FJW02_02010 [Pantoea eucalypti]